MVKFHDVACRLGRLPRSIGTSVAHRWAALPDENSSTARIQIRGDPTTAVECMAAPNTQLTALARDWASCSAFLSWYLPARGGQPRHRPSAKHFHTARAGMASTAAERAYTSACFMYSTLARACLTTGASSLPPLMVKIKSSCKPRIAPNPGHQRTRVGTRQI